MSNHRWAAHIAGFGLAAAIAAVPARATFEDIYGPSGASFRGAVGFRVYEGTTATGDATAGFGATIDDMVVQWREYKLVEDATDCATSGACASIAIDSTIHEANGSVAITVIDRSPYGQTTPVNDCNQDGDFTDAGVDDQDCNDNGTTDVVVRAISFPDLAGDPVVLDRVGSSDAYRGTLAISNVTKAAGVHFYQGLVTRALPGSGSEPYFFYASDAELTIRYADRWDGSASGIECRASSDPAEWGFVSQHAAIPFRAGEVGVVSYRISDAPGSGMPPLPAGQDGDGFPDTNETVDLFLTVRNPTLEVLSNLSAQIWTNDPKIDCVLRSLTGVESVPARSNVNLPIALRFKVASTADRSGVAPPASCVAGSCSNGAGTCSLAADCARTASADYFASFMVFLASDQFDGAALPQSIRVDLDLNVSAPVKATTTFVEGFETGMGSMLPVSLDDGIATNTLSNGRRCQYTDPDSVNSYTHGWTECYLGFAAGQTNSNDWHVEGTTSPDGGRAFTGARSLHYGIHGPGPGLETEGLSQMDTVRTLNALNLAARVCRDDIAADKRSCSSAADCIGFGGGPCVSANPELSFKHQISLMDTRSIGSRDQAADRAVVQSQLFPGSAIWENLNPYENVYDIEASDGYNCMFDPIDDGNTEDDYFDPSDPDRRFGPSSTCYPGLVFAYDGDTDAPFDTNNIGRASEGPGLAGSLGLGTWVESKFDLSRYRGRQIRIRWLITSFKAGDTPTAEALFHWNPQPGDDGWYVDDVRVTQTLGSSAPVASLDTRDTSALPACGAACSTVTAVVAASPSTTPSPGIAIGLSTNGSLADRCNGGTLLSEFWIDGDANGALGDPADVLLRPPTVDPLFDDAPLVTTRYGARVSCSSAPTCSDTAFVVVTVNCPGTPGAYDAGAWWTRLRFTNKTTLVTPAANQALDAVRGNLASLRSSGGFGGEVCLADGSASPTLVDPSIPTTASGYYYLVRGADSACNENRSWRTFSSKENPSDPARRDAQISACSP